jgi:BMFP domain-containing protein YqiC
MDRKQIDATVKKFMDALPPGMREFKQDLEKNFRSVLQTTFAKMDLVTRQEFDVQAEVLKRTREKLDKLEKKLAEMEKSFAGKKTGKK